MYSQNNEEQIIVDFFGGYHNPRVSRFLDIGANNGVANSNTYALAHTFNWSGICIEPSTMSFYGLAQLYRNNPLIETVNACIDDTAGLKEFWLCGDEQLSSLDEAHRNRIGIERFYKIYIPSITIHDVIKQFGTGFKFISLDVESVNLKILKTLPLQELGCELLCVEHDPKQPILDYLREINWRVIAETSENLLAVPR